MGCVLRSLRIGTAFAQCCDVIGLQRMQTLNLDTASVNTDTPQMPQDPNPDSYCVSIQGLHPSEEHLKANYVTTPREGCTNWKTPPNAAHECSFFSLFLEASHIPRFFARPKKKKEREKMTTSRGVDHHCRGRNHDVRVKHLVVQPGNAPQARPSHLTTADKVNKVSLKDSPSKTTKAESFRGHRP